MASDLSQFDTSIGLPNAVVRHRFTVDQYHDMIDRGFFAEDEHVEFIHGEVLRRKSIGNPHAATVKRINRLLSKRLPGDKLVSIQDPISLGDSEPEPDVAVLSFRDDLYASRRPVADDVHLLLEVADSSLAYDREIKTPIYAEAGIRDFWIVNLTNRTIEVYREPQSDGRYAAVYTARVGEHVSPLEIEGLSISVEEIVGATT